LTCGIHGRARRVFLAACSAFALAAIASAAPVARGVMQGTVYLHSGELEVTALDLDAGGRAGWNVVIRRVYRSRTLWEGPLGETWDATIFRHLDALPNGDVEYHDGEGDIWLFQQKGTAYAAPKGLFLRLARQGDGWVLVDQQWRVTTFDDRGRLTSEGDEFVQLGNSATGNTIRYLYGTNGQLQTIVDPVGRATTLAYYESGHASEGHLKEITDWRGHRVTYLYDGSRRLTEVQLPEVSNATSGGGRPAIRYGYQPGPVSYKDIAELGQNLVSITDPNEVATGGPPRVTFAYELTGPNRDRLVRETWATGEVVTFAYVSPTQVDVTDALGQVRSHTIAGTGHDARVMSIIERQVPASTAPVGQLPVVGLTGIGTASEDRTWTFRYDELDGLLTNATLVGVQSTDYGYQSAAGAPGRILDHTTTAPVTAATEAITRTLTYQSKASGCANNCATFLQSIEANGLSIEIPEWHRGALEPVATNDEIEAKTKLDAHGRPLAMSSSGGTDPAGGGSAETITYVSDSALPHERGEIARIDRGGQITTFTYVTPDQTVIRGAREITRTIDYDSWRRPTHVAVTGPGLAFDERLVYDASGNVVRHVRRQGTQEVSTTFGYDTAGRVTRVSVDKIAAGSGTLTTTTSYDLPNRKIVTTLPSGAAVTQELDGLGRVQREITATGSSPIEYRFAYDRAGNPVFATDTQVASVSAFDVHGREVATRLTDGTSVLRTFDAWGRVTSEETRDSSGATITSQISFDRTPAGRLRSLTTKVDADVTRQTTLAWDGGGRTTGVGSGGRASHATFDSAGRLTSTAFGEGSATSLEATVVSQQVTSHSGALPQSFETREKTGAAIDVELEFDTAANVVSGRIGSSLEWNQTFDQAGNVTSAAPPERAPSTFTYDARSALTRETMPDGAQNAYSYAESGALASYIDPSNEPAVQVDADLIGRPLKRTYADGTIELLTYDHERLASFTDRQNRIQLFSYNSRGQLTDVDRQAGEPLERFEYDEAGRLVSWKNADSELRWSDFNYEGAPKKTVQRRFRNGSGFSSPIVLDEFEQSHEWNEHGERTRFSMPVYNGMTISSGWTTSIEQQYDALGNVIEVKRGAAPLMSASYRNAGRPDLRTVTTAAGATIRRSYGYDDATSQLNRLVVDANGMPIAGSDVAFDGLQIRSAQLLGVASDQRFTHWSYDERSRLRASIAGATATADLSAPIPGRAQEEQTPADFRLAQERISQFDGPTSAALAAKRIDTSAVDPPTATFEEKPGGGHKISKVTKGAKSYAFAWNGAERVDDGRFLYEFDAKGRLIRATEKTIGAPIRRLVYSYSGTGRLLGRRAEYAVNASPSEDDWRLEDRPTILAADGLPAETTYVWDPISDNLIALFKSGPTPSDPHGGLLKQIIHGGAAYDDPIEVATIDGVTGTVKHLYPIYDEAGAGSLQVVINEQGQVVARTLANDAYGAEDIDFTGAAIDGASVRMTKDAAGALAQVEITLHATERLDPSTVATGVRLATVDATSAVVRTSTATAVLAPEDPFTIRWTLTSTQWSNLIAPTSAAPLALSIAVTPTLRANAWGSNAPVMPPPDWAIATQPVYTSPNLPVEIREPLASLKTFASNVAASETATSTIYAIETLALAGNTSTSSFIENTVSARFQALPFAEPATGLIYARARWYDANTGAFLSPDPLGHLDSSNLYAFCHGDPVNCRDPRGLADEEMDVILRKIQAAADEATSIVAKRHDVTSRYAAEKGLFGSEIHKVIQELLSDRKRAFYHPRIVTEVEVNGAGVVTRFGRRRFAPLNSMVKDIIVLAPEAKIAVGMEARAVTQLVVDLKTGLLGAPLRQTETLKRFGVTNLVLRPFESVALQRGQSLRIMRRLKAAQAIIEMLPAASRMLGAAALFMSADEAKAALVSGDIDRAADLLSGNFIPGVAHVMGEDAERRAQAWEDRIGVSRKAKQQQIDEFDGDN
jgi:RHS repeat-associated protein